MRMKGDKSGISFVYCARAEPFVCCRLEKKNFLSFKLMVMNHFQLYGIQETEKRKLILSYETRMRMKDAVCVCCDWRE